MANLVIVVEYDLEVSTGQVLKETDWFLHDARRYLWRLGSGKVLLRKLNSLYAVGADLHEKLLLTLPQDLLWVSGRFVRRFNVCAHLWLPDGSWLHRASGIAGRFAFSHFQASRPE